MLYVNQDFIDTRPSAGKNKARVKGEELSNVPKMYRDCWLANGFVCETPPELDVKALKKSGQTSKENEGGQDLDAVLIEYRLQLEEKEKKALVALAVELGIYTKSTANNKKAEDLIDVLVENKKEELNGSESD